MWSQVTEHHIIIFLIYLPYYLLKYLFLFSHAGFCSFYRFIGNFPLQSERLLPKYISPFSIYFHLLLFVSLYLNPHENSMGLICLTTNLCYKFCKRIIFPCSVYSLEEMYSLIWFPAFIFLKGTNDSYCLLWSVIFSMNNSPKRNICFTDELWQQTICFYILHSYLSGKSWD